MIYGFTKRTTAKNLAAIARQGPPSQWASPPAMAGIRNYVIKTPYDGIPAANPETTAGKAMCELYHIDAGSFNIVRTTEWDYTLNQEVNASIEALNITGADLEGEKFFTAMLVDGRAMVTTGGVGSNKDMIYAEVDSPAGPKLWNVTPVHSFDGDASLPGPFVLDMSAQPDAIQPMYPTANGMTPSAKDSLILVKSKNNFGEQPPEEGEPDDYEWIGTNVFVARWITGTITIPANYSPGGADTFTNVPVGAWWEGENPGPATVDYFVPSVLVGCQQAQTVNFWGAWKPESRKYEVVATISAMLGNPRVERVQQGPLTHKAQTGSDPNCSTTGVDQYEQEQTRRGWIRL